MTGYQGHRFARVASGAFTPKTREVIYVRDQYACARCGSQLCIEIQHRRARAMGGSRDPVARSASNGILLCRACHAWVEAHPALAEAAGWRVRQGVDPSTVPVRHLIYGWVTLTDRGTVIIADGLS